MRNTRVIPIVLVGSGFFSMGCGQSKILGDSKSGGKAASTNPSEEAKDQPTPPPPQTGTELDNKDDEEAATPPVPSEEYGGEDTPPFEIDDDGHGPELVADKNVLRNGETVTLSIVLRHGGDVYKVDSFEWPLTLGENLYSVDGEGTYAALDIKKSAIFSPQIFYKDMILTEDLSLVAKKRYKSLKNFCVRYCNGR